MDVIYFFPLEKHLFLSWNGAKKKILKKGLEVTLVKNYP